MLTFVFPSELMLPSKRFTGSSTSFIDLYSYFINLSNFSSLWAAEGLMMSLSAGNFISDRFLGFYKKRYK